MAPSPEGELEGGFRGAGGGLWIVGRTPLDSLNLSFASRIKPYKKHVK